MIAKGTKEASEAIARVKESLKPHKEKDWAWPKPVIKSGMTNLQLAVCQLRYEGHTYRYIAEHMKIHEENVFRIIKYYYHGFLAKKEKNEQERNIQVISDNKE